MARLEKGTGEQKIAKYALLVSPLLVIKDEEQRVDVELLEQDGVLEHGEGVLRVVAGDGVGVFGKVVFRSKKRRD